MIFGLLAIALVTSGFGWWKADQNGHLRQVAGAAALSTDAALRLASDPALAQSVAADALALQENSRSVAVAMDALGAPLHKVSTVATNHPLTALVPSPGGRFVASADAAGGLQVRKTDSQQDPPIATHLGAHDGRVSALAFSRDGTWLLSAGADRVLRLWDAKNLELIGEASGQGLDEIVSLAAVVDDNTMVGGGVDGKLTVWQLGPGGLERIGDMPTQSKGITALGASPEGDRLVSGAPNGMLRLWDTANWQADDGGLVGEFTQPRYYAAVSVIAFAPDGQSFAAATTANDLDLWQVEGLEHLRNLDGQHTGAVTALAFEPEGKQLVSGAQDRSAVLWRLDQPQVSAERLGDLAGPVNAVVFAEQGEQVWTSSGSEPVLTSWAASSEQVLGQPLIGHRAPVNAIVLSSDRRTLISGDAAGKLLFWDLASRERLGDPVLDDEKSPVTGLALDRQDQVLVVAHENGVLKVLDAQTHAVRQRMTTPGKTAKVWGISLARDGQTLATAGDDHLIRLWNLSSGEQTATLTGHGEPVQDVAFSPDGAVLASSGNDGTVRLWDVNSHAPLGPVLLDKPGVRVWGVAFSPDGSRLAASGQDGTVRVWNVGNRALVAELDNDDAPVDDVAFAGADHVVATNGDGLIRLWDVRNRALVGAPMKGHTGWADAVAVDPATRTAFTGGDDATVRLWNLDREKWLPHLCRRASRSLTEHEWKIILPDNDYRPRCERAA
ncbi:WD40 repeat domain-containing protein [Kineosporia babensis]|uniref:WD40 repeat domain-containing protein n=1 Tax=Kineosporia babensis TaxID=499548 RepID=A0A9X1NCR6_9ACTN|nr:WD40 repeat domain-containing protein [Kineosporia babensis]MCD5311325.1 WD40 repeat domain-containing protein [Kineosporia babensis]